MKLYHPDLPKGQNVIEISEADGEEAAKASAEIHKQSGWTEKAPTKKAEEAEPANTPGPSARVDK